MVGQKHLTEADKASIVTARSYGTSCRLIAEQIGCGKTTVARICNSYAALGHVKRLPGSGRLLKTSERTTRLIMREVEKNRRSTGPEIKHSLGLDNISERTVRRRIAASGDFKSYWATKKNYVNEINRKKRLAWCNAKLGWTIEQWRSVLWSDESPYVLVFNKKMRVWRRHNERYNTQCTVATVKHDKKINVWGCFSARGQGDLHRVDGILEQIQYREILEDHMLPSADDIFGADAWLFQQDNDPKHTAKLTKKWFADNGVPVIDWPAQSPDLNPIEKNLWSILDERTKGRRPASEDALFKCLQEAWDALPIDLLEKLADSMPRRLQAVIENNGYATKY
jgi:transposase